MQVDVLTLVVSTAITGVVGWMVKAVMDALRSYADESREWRRGIEAKLDEQAAKTDKLMDATQATMRTELVHLYEKYMTREWMTPEESAAWCDMHDRYSAMGFNGLIDSYRARLMTLPIREV